jgi:citronellol/citronellal dehydrogenase
MRKVAFITGGSRGIGKAIGLKLAREGWDIVVAAKTVKPHPKLAGTIHTAAEEIAQHGTEVLPVQCNVADLESVDAAVAATLDKFGRIDAVINNAGALWWRDMTETPMKRFDLVMDVNARGAFAVTAGFLPTMIEQNSGHVIMMSPPIDMHVVPGHIAYCISKFGMTMTVHGLADELADTAVSATALWPKTMIESFATKNYGMGGPKQWRKADVLADATYEILQRPAETKGLALIDEDYLRSVGYTDFDRYKCVPDGNPVELTADVFRASRS